MVAMLRTRQYGYGISVVCGYVIMPPPLCRTHPPVLLIFSFVPLW